MTKTYEFTIATNIVGSDVSDIVEFDDDCTEKEIEEVWKEWVWENVDGGYSEVEE